MDTSLRVPVPAMFLVFFLSGMAGLVYQVAWSRLLTLVIGFSIFTYMIGDEQRNPTRVLAERMKEYAAWGDPASTIVPDPCQAKRLDVAIRRRMSGQPGDAAVEAVIPGCS